MPTPKPSVRLADRLTDQLRKLELVRRRRLGEGVARLTRQINPLTSEWLVNTRKLIATGQLAAAQEAISYVNAYVINMGGRPVNLDGAITGVDKGYLGGRLGLNLDRNQRLGREVARRDGEAAARLWMARRTKRVASDLAWQAGQETVRAAIALHPDIEGYRRVASFGACGGCLAMATGAVLPPSEAFLRHPSCRCTCEPVVRGAPSLDRPTGQDYFNGLTEIEQNELLGREKAELLRAGQIKFADLAYRPGTGARGMVVERPLHLLEASTAA